MQVLPRAPTTKERTRNVMAIKNHLIQGKALYCKVIGDPVPGFDEDQLEWTFDLVLDEDNKQKLLSSGAAPQYIKEHKVTGEEYVRFTRKAIKKDGSKGAPIRVVNAQGDDWGTDLIGNGSVLNVSYALNEVGRGKDLRLKPAVLALQVWSHVPFKPKGGFPTKAAAEGDTEGTTAEW